MARLTGFLNFLKANPLLPAFLLSLLLHALVVAAVAALAVIGVSVGNPVSQSSARVEQAAAEARQRAARDIPLIFVDVDPALASAEPPPKDTPFYSAVDSVAANPEPPAEQAEMPKVEGLQTVVPKTTDPGVSQAQPLQPSAEPAPDEAEVASTPPPRQEARPAGDLAMAKPIEENVIGAIESEETPVQAPPARKRSRPRTVAEALRRQGLSGERVRQEGGVMRTGVATLDAKGTSFGSYDAEFIAAVQHHWYSLVDEWRGSARGKVVLEFRLNHDGRITDMKMVESEVGEVPGLICQQAILRPAPFRPWPVEMRRELPADHREVRFTFHYLGP